MQGTAVSADGLAVRFEVHGEGAPALVFVHGWSCDRGYWKHQIGEFSHRHRVVAIDLAGHGESGTDRSEWTMAAFGDDVVAVVQQLGFERTALIGHSMGGDVIVETARRAPFEVAGLVWVDTYRTLGEPQTAESTERFLAPFSDDFAAATRHLVRGMFLPTSEPDLAEWVVSDMASAPPDIGVNALRHAVTFEPKVIAALRQINAPVVAINPDYRPNDVATLSRHGVRTVLMSGVGHFPMLEDPLEFNRLLGETVTGFAAGGEGATPQGL